MAETPGLLVGDLEGASVVYGVHGSGGDSRWKCLARPVGLRGTWEAVEWAWLPPGGLSGEHRHTRTEEIYFILSGSGLMTLDDESHRVGPGHLILTGLGTRHSLRNVASDGLDWLVIELLSPATAAVTHRSETKRTHAMKPNPITAGARPPANAAIFDLRRERQVDPRSVFTGPLRTIYLLQLPSGQRSELVAAADEHTLFVLGGSGTATSADTTVALARGVSLTLPLGSSVTLTGGTGPLECFVASLAVQTERSS
jgi:mannose-6-phosphate isomerase-like protein (cupin superfamily)